MPQSKPHQPTKQTRVGGPRGGWCFRRLLFRWLLAFDSKGGPLDDLLDRDPKRRGGSGAQVLHSTPQGLRAQGHDKRFISAPIFEVLLREFGSAGHLPQELQSYRPGCGLKILAAGEWTVPRGTRAYRGAPYLERGSHKSTKHTVVIFQGREIDLACHRRSCPPWAGLRKALELPTKQNLPR